jgi:hypothetical protein
MGADASKPPLGPPKPTSTFTNLGVGCSLAFAFIVVLFIAAGINGSGVNENGDSRTRTPADSATAAVRMCESLVKDKLLSPANATFAPFVMKRDPTTRVFVGRGQATAPNPVGVSITHRFVCLIDPDKSGSGKAVLRNSNPELYEEIVRLGGL